MSTKAFQAEVVILIFLSSITLPDTSNPGLKCSADHTRIVQKVIYKKFIPILERYKTSFPMECPFHVSRDIYGRKREGPELEGRSKGVVCWICGHSFDDDHQLQKHYEQVHAHSLILQEGAVCLANYCTIMRCNVLMANEWLASLNISKIGSDGKQQKVQWEDLDWWTSSTAENEDKTESEPVGKSAAREALKAKEAAKRGHCDAQELKALQKKCQVIIRSCISGLVLSLSPKDIQEIEDDMNRAVCSFLTCEKFWEDSLIEESRYPLGFFLAVLAMLCIGMVICYYIVWVVFDSGENYNQEECYEVYVLYSERLTDGKSGMLPSVAKKCSEFNKKTIVHR
ncbi:hypothetical protein CHUAL_012328 [Chamberlinius hualienensis]